jgi:hypothetical protein
MGREIAYHAGGRAVMDHKAEDKGVEEEDPGTISQRPTPPAVKL